MVKTNFPKLGKRKAKSQFEVDTFKSIRGLCKKGDKVTYENSELEYVISFKYVPDFEIELADGRVFYIEAKGLGRPFDYDSRRKLETVKAQHPDKDIRIVFYRDGILRKGSKFRASDWARKHGFPFAIGRVPKEWFE